MAPLPRTLLQAPPPDEAVPAKSYYVLVLAILLCTLICVAGLMAVARCALRTCLRGVLDRVSPSSEPRLPANRGLTKKVLKSLPIIKYTTPVNPQTELHTECAICLAEFVEGAEIRVMPQCGHAFHVVCIDKWLRLRSSCPSCRQRLGFGRCEKCDKLNGGAVELKATGANSSNAAEITFLP